MTLVLFISGRMLETISSVYRYSQVSWNRWRGSSDRGRGRGESTIKTKYGVLSRIWNTDVQPPSPRGRDWTIATGTILDDRTMNFSTSAAFFLSAETDDRERTVKSVYTRFCIPCRHDIYLYTRLFHN